MIEADAFFLADREPPTRGGRIFICPDCFGMVHAKRCVRQDVPGVGAFVLCPDCAVGSPVREWKEGRHS